MARRHRQCLPPHGPFPRRPETHAVFPRRIDRSPKNALQLVAASMRAGRVGSDALARCPERFVDLRGARRISRSFRSTAWRPAERVGWLTFAAAPGLRGSPHSKPAGGIDLQKPGGSSIMPSIVPTQRVAWGPSPCSRYIRDRRLRRRQNLTERSRGKLNA
jgi:hypothetical protein